MESPCMFLPISPCVSAFNQLDNGVRFGEGQTRTTFLVLLVFILLGSPSLFAQVPSGVPQFGTFQGAPIDTVNLASLNTHIEIPIRNTPGRALPFSAALNQETAIYSPYYDTHSLIWYWALNWGTDPNYPNETTGFAPRTSVNYGSPVPLSVIRKACTMQGYSTTATFVYPAQNGIVTIAGVGFDHFLTPGDIVTFSNFQHNSYLNGIFVTLLSVTDGLITYSGATQGPGGADTGTVTRATDLWTVGDYQDIHNTMHPSQSATLDSVGCITGTTSSYEGSYDGYITKSTITPNTQQANDSLLVTVTTPRGTVLSSTFCAPGPSPCGNGTSTTTDTNGNQLLVSEGSSGSQYSDSSGNQVLTRNWSGGGSTEIFSWTGPNSTNEEVVVTYTNLVIGPTNFQCSGLPEHTKQTFSLPTKIALPDGSSYSIAYEYSSGRVNSITLPTGGTVKYTYNGLNGGISCQDGGTSGFTRQTPDGTWTYSRSYNPTTLMWTTTVFDPQGNETVYTFSGPQTIHSPACLSPFCTQAQYEVQRQTYELVNGKQVLMQTIVTCYNGNFSNCTQSLVTTGSNPAITQVDRYTYLPGVANPSLSEQRYTNALLTEDKEFDFGATLPPGSNPISDRVIQYGSYSNGTCTPLGNNLLNRPCTDITTSGSSTLAQTTYQYDANGNLLSLGALVGGTTFLTKAFSYYPSGLVNVATDVNNSKTSPATTTYIYNDCNSSFPTSIASTVTSQLTLTTSMTWDCTGEGQTAIIDENSQSTTYSYVDPTTGYLDPYYRVTAVTDPLDNITHWTYSPTTIEHSLLFNSNTSTVDVLSTADTQGRQYLMQTKEAPSSTSYDTVVRGYDSDGRPATFGVPCVALASQPCTSGVTSTIYDNLGRKTQVTDGGGRFTTYNYAPGGTYNNDVLITVGPAASGEKSKLRQLEYDGLGRVSSICEISATLSGVGTCGQSTAQTGYWTRYKYDGLGHLIGVCENTTQPLTVDCVSSPSSGQQTRTYSYDSLGRLVSETNPESGTTTYTYDTVAANYCTNSSAYSSFGDLVARSDANGHICYQYDALHRLTDVTNNAPSSTNVCKRLRYDTVSSAATTQPSGYSSTPYVSGRLMEGETDNCSGTLITDEWFSYDQDGNMTDKWELTPHSTQYYHSKASFYANGQINTLQLASPSLYTMTWGIDGEGRWNTLADSTTNTNLVKGASFFPAANPFVISLANSDSDSFTLDTNTGRMTKYAFTVSSSTMTGSLNWNTNGTLNQLTITDPFNSGGAQTCNYNPTLAGNTGYDDLGRLIGVDCGSGQWGQTFGYDAFGNLSKTAMSGRTGTTWNPGYSIANNHCLTCGYDGDGNVTSDGNANYGWNLDSKLAWAATYPGTASCGSSGRCLTYDAFGNIVEQSNGSTWTERWITQLDETVYMNATTPSFAYWPSPGAGQVLIYQNSGAFDFLHTDWLGSARIDSNLLGHNVFTDQAYTPFNEIYDIFGSNVAQNEIFGTLRGDFFPSTTTPMMWDASNRELSIVSHWLSPDPAGLNAVDPGNPQSWNRYSYVLNNPLLFTDSQGLDNDCGGPCIDFSYWNDRGCYVNIVYFKVKGPDGNTYDMPDAATYCPTDPYHVGYAFVNIRPPVRFPHIGFIGVPDSNIATISAANNGNSRPTDCRYVDPLTAGIEITGKIGPGLQAGPVDVGLNMFTHTLGEEGTGSSVDVGFKGILSIQGERDNAWASNPMSWSVTILGFNLSRAGWKFQPSKEFKFGGQAIVGVEIGWNSDKFKQQVDQNIACGYQNGPPQ